MNTLLPPVPSGLLGTIVDRTLSEGVDLARLILGDDFISPVEVAKAYGFSYSEYLLLHFADTLPDLETLMWLRTNGHMLVAGPNTNTNLLDVRDLDNQLFYLNMDGWFEEEEQTFSRTIMVRGGQWLMLRKSDMPNSRSKNWKEQSSLVIDPERVPNAAEVSYGVTVYRKVRGVYLLPNCYVRTSSVSADNCSVCVGRQGERGLSVIKCWNEGRYDGVGVSSARNLECVRT